MFHLKGEEKQPKIRSALRNLFKKITCETDLGYTVQGIGCILRKEAKLDVGGTITIKCLLDEFGCDVIDRERNKLEKRQSLSKRTRLIRENPVKKTRMPHSNDRMYCLTHGI